MNFSSIGANFEVEHLEISGLKGVELHNVSSSAARNVLSSIDGSVSIFLGHNSYASLSQQSSSDAAWRRIKTESVQQQTFSAPSIVGIIEVNASELNI